jgi:chromosome segregation ATPase
MMEKGSFHTSLPVQETLETAVRKVPLPNQLPKGIDFSDLPVGQLRSATLESLINQNEDLMARLSVSLRRTNEFEDKVHRLETENSSLRTRFETLKEQFMLTQEKDRISASRSLQVHEENVGTKRQLEKLEKVYSELFVQAQAFQQRMIRLERHQARLRKAARNLQKQTKLMPSLRRELDESAALQQHAALVHQQTVQSYEAKLGDVRAEIDSMRTKISERDALYAEKVKIENQLVYSQRQFEIQREEQQALTDRLSEENTSMRVQLKEALIAAEAAKQESARLSQELPSLRNEKQNLTEQVESLQALWSHKQTELEAGDQKNKALQKLNQSISLTLNQQRKEIHGLEQELEKERFTAAEKIKTLLAEIQMLRTKA